jgi:hypothetical protein
VDNATALQTIWTGLSANFTPNRNGDADARTAKWRCRFRLYREENGDEPIADTDADQPPDRPGHAVIAGLPNVAAELVGIASGFHGKSPVVGLSREAMERRLKGLRPTLSRRGGNAVWRVPYRTIENFNGQSTERGWLMRVDIVREQETAQ